MDIPLFIHSSLGGHLDCFHLLATVNNSAIDIHAGVFGFFFQRGPFLKSLLNLLQYLLLSHLLAFWTGDMWNPSSLTRDQTCTP